MPFIPIPNGVQLCFDFLTGGQNWQFCLTIRKSAGAPVPSDLLTAATAGASWWTGNLKPHISNNCVLRQVRATDMTVSGGPQSIVTVGTAGTDANPAMPNNAAVVVSLRTELRGRSYRGRAYLSGVPRDAQNNAVDVSTDFAGDIADEFVALAGQLDVLGFDIVVASKQHNGVVTNPAAVHEVIAYIVDTHFDSQRRRLAGRGT